MKQTLAVFFLTFILYLPVKAQLYVEPICGFAFDTNNKKPLNQFNTGLQVVRKFSSGYELYLMFQYASGLKRSGADSAFTTNLSLPLVNIAEKTIAANTFSIGIGNRIKLAGWKSNTIFIPLQVGYAETKMKVIYDIDKFNYTILNPDRSERYAGTFFGIGGEYMKQFRHNRLFANILFQPTISFTKNRFPNSYLQNLPLSANIGYSFQLGRLTEN